MEVAWNCSFGFWDGGVGAYRRKQLQRTSTSPWAKATACPPVCAVSLCQLSLLQQSTARSEQLKVPAERYHVDGSTDSYKYHVFIIQYHTLNNNLLHGVLNILKCPAFIKKQPFIPWQDLFAAILVWFSWATKALSTYSPTAIHYSDSIVSPGETDEQVEQAWMFNPSPLTLDSSAVPVCIKLCRTPPFPHGDLRSVVGRW